MTLEESLFAELRVLQKELESEIPRRFPELKSISPSIWQGWSPAQYWGPGNCDGQCRNTHSSQPRGGQVLELQTDDGQRASTDYLMAAVSIGLKAIKVEM